MSEPITVPGGRPSVDESEARQRTFNAKLKSELGNRRARLLAGGHADLAKLLPWTGHLVGAPLSAIESVIAVVLERAMLKAEASKYLEPAERRESKWVSGRDLWCHMYDHHVDPTDGTTYYRTARGDYHRVEGAEGIKQAASDLPAEVIGRLKFVPAEAPGAQQIAPAPGELPIAPEKLRRLAKGLVDKGLPYTGSTRPGQGFCFFSAVEELVELQQTERARIASTLTRMEREAEVALRAEHFAKTGELRDLPKSERSKQQTTGAEYAAQWRIAYANRNVSEHEIAEKTAVFREVDDYVKQ